jgi:hypothetical protein
MGSPRARTVLSIAFWLKENTSRTSWRGSPERTGRIYIARQRRSFAFAGGELPRHCRSQGNETARQAGRARERAGRQRGIHDCRVYGLRQKPPASSGTDKGSANARDSCVTAGPRVRPGNRNERPILAECPGTGPFPTAAPDPRNRYRFANSASISALSTGVSGAVPPRRGWKQSGIPRQIPVRSHSNAPAAATKPGQRRPNLQPVSLSRKPAGCRPPETPERAQSRSPLSSVRISSLENRRRIA